jgi:23S rRNA (cytidine1920-2'-O)/16S rRNA (cytidine1409-2'-O)-methyltransferase
VKSSTPREPFAAVVARLREGPSPAARLQGRRKLAWALSRFAVAVEGRTALDVGASSGGFTAALLDGGAARVVAVDAGHGQLLGMLRRDPRVVCLERTNVADLSPALLGTPIDIVTIDVSYLALAAAVRQVTDRVALVGGAELVGLVKPMFELGLPTIPSERAVLDEALARAGKGIAAAGWAVVDAAECPVRGHRGAVEFFVHARWPGAARSRMQQGAGAKAGHQPTT